LPSTSVSPTGTWLWRLEPDNSWTNVLRLAASTGTKADALAVGDTTHVLLHGSSSTLVSVEYVAATNTYRLWTARPTATAIPLPGSETATIAVDSTDRLWLSPEPGPNLPVYYACPPDRPFNRPTVLAT